MRPKVVIALNTSWNIFNFRAGLIKGLQKAGYDVVAVAPKDAYSVKLTEMGCFFVEIPMDNDGTHPGKDFMLFVRYLRTLRRFNPVAMLSYTIKPNIYGSIAARLLSIPVINNVAGLGAVFINHSLLTRFVRLLYRRALSGSAKVFFQNSDDLLLFIRAGIVSSRQTELIPGSGIDLEKYRPTPLPNGDAIRFLLIGRMIFDKGIREYVSAARLLQKKGLRARFTLLGFLDVKNPAAISRTQMDEWVDEGIIEYLGETDNVQEFIENSDCVVLPSYREGTPRCLLEAAAMGRPIVTTDAVGCREVVDDGINGFLCKPRDEIDLANKLERIVNLSNEERVAMGAQGRIKVEVQFDEQIVIAKYLTAIENILKIRSSGYE